MRPFSVLPELKVGTVVEVAGDAIRIQIDSEVSELTRTHAGDVYPVGQCGSILKLHAGRQVLFAYVRVLRMRSEIALEHGAPPPSEDARMIEATLFAEGQWSTTQQSLDLSRGITTYPLPAQSVYLTTLEELSALYGAGQSFKLPRHRIRLGNYVGAADSVCYADVDKMFGLHCAILGSTGAGKSATVSAVLHALLDASETSDGRPTKLRPRVILIDPHGEYARAFEKKSRAHVFRAYSNHADVDVPRVSQLRLPYWLMTGEEYRDLIIGKSQWEATTENNLVLKALRHSRLVGLGLIEAARTDWKGKSVTIAHPSDDRLTEEGKADPDRVGGYDHDTPDTFSLIEFRNYVAHELKMRATTKDGWDELSPSASESHNSILDKLNVLQRDPRLQFMMQEQAQDDINLPSILQQFVGDIPNSANADIRIVDISGLPNEVAGPLTASIARILFQYKVWQTRAEREADPVLLVCEEAHRYVPDTGLAEYASAQKAIRRLAKEGRKYGVGMMLVSQRPADVEGTVLSQCNSWLVLRLTNTVDQQHVSKFLPDNLAGLARMLPSLSRQEAIFVGEAAALPARIKVRTLEEDELPQSDDVSFGKGWLKSPMSLGDIEKVVNRWRRNSSAIKSESTGTDNQSPLTSESEPQVRKGRGKKSNT